MSKGATFYKIPYPPSVNHIWTRTQKGATLSREYRKWKESALVSIYFERRPTPARLYEVRIILFPQDERPRDVDNGAKAILDLFTSAGFWDDDRQVARLSIERGHLSENSFAVAYVEPYELLAAEPEKFNEKSKATREEIRRARLAIDRNPPKRRKNERRQ